MSEQYGLELTVAEPNTFFPSPFSPVSSFALWALGYFSVLIFI